MKLLSEPEYRATFGPRMVRAGPDEAPLFDFWPYFEAIPQADFEGFDCTAGQVHWVYRDSEGKYENVLVSSQDKNVFMALILDRGAQTVIGHRLLNLRREYGLDEEESGAA